MDAAREKGSVDIPASGDDPGFAGEIIIGTIVLRYADGTEYLVKGEDTANFVVAAMNGLEHWFAVNRLADAENITEIEAFGSWIDVNEVETEHDYIVVM